MVGTRSFSIGTSVEESSGRRQLGKSSWRCYFIKPQPRNPAATFVSLTRKMEIKVEMHSSIYGSTVIRVIWETSKEMAVRRLRPETSSLPPCLLCTNPWPSQTNKLLGGVICGLSYLRRSSWYMQPFKISGQYSVPLSPSSCADHC